VAGEYDMKEIENRRRERPRTERLMRGNTGIELGQYFVKDHAHGKLPDLMAMMPELGNKSAIGSWDWIR